MCHVFYDEYPKDSRVRRYTLFLLKKGYTVIIICSRGEGEPKTEHHPDLHIFRIPVSKKRKSIPSRLWEYLQFLFIAAMMVIYMMVKYRPSVFHVHTLPDFLVFACIVPRMFGKKVILDFHELFPEFMMQLTSKSCKSFVIELLLLQEKLSFWFATDIIVFHDPAKDLLSRRIPSKKEIVTVMNGIDVTEFNNITRVQQKKFNIVYNGTISHYLNLPLILDAMMVIRSQKKEIFDSIEFHIYGDGPATAGLLAKADLYGLRNVFYHGRMPFHLMVQELSKASVCILPPKQDIYSDLYYSLKLLEMIYLSIPVIATDLKTYRFYFPEGCIFYFPSGEIEQLAERMIEVFTNPEKVGLYTKRALVELRKNDWSEMLKRYEKILN